VIRTVLSLFRTFVSVCAYLIHLHLIYPNYFTSTSIVWWLCCSPHALDWTFPFRRSHLQTDIHIHLHLYSHSHSLTARLTLIALTSQALGSSVCSLCGLSLFSFGSSFNPFQLSAYLPISPIFRHSNPWLASLLSYRFGLCFCLLFTFFFYV